MTDHKFTDDEVIKALRELQEMSEFTPPICHYEKDITEPPFCKPFEQFQNDAKVALALINHQNAEIKMLKTIGDYKTREVLRHDAAIRELHKQLKTAKAEAIKEFAERLKSHLIIYTYINLNDAIDTLVKEMTEGNHESQST